MNHEPHPEDTTRSSRRSTSRAKWRRTSCGCPSPDEGRGSRSSRPVSLSGVQHRPPTSAGGGRSAPDRSGTPIMYHPKSHRGRGTGVSPDVTCPTCPVGGPVGPGSGRLVLRTPTGSVDRSVGWTTLSPGLCPVTSYWDRCGPLRTMGLPHPVERVWVESRTPSSTVSFLRPGGTSLERPLECHGVEKVADRWVGSRGPRLRDLLSGPGLGWVSPRGCPYRLWDLIRGPSFCLDPEDPGFVPWVWSETDVPGQRRRGPEGVGVGGPRTSTSPGRARGRGGGRGRDVGGGGWRPRGGGRGRRPPGRRTGRAGTGRRRGGVSDGRPGA